MASSTNKTVQIVAAFAAGVALGYVVSMAPQQDDGMSGTIAPGTSTHSPRDAIWPAQTLDDAF